MHSNLDVMAVCADEQFDYQAMQTYLQTHIPQAEGPLEVRQFGGGRAETLPSPTAYQFDPMQIPHLLPLQR